jgi:prepilin signal peptidase PulO-like enzyme (type II secretory pathway)
MILAALPLAGGLLLAAIGGLAAGAYVNWAAYTLAWNRRAISPWAAAHPEAPARRRSDFIPLVGWLGMRREAPLHGEGFWRRPFLVELTMALAWAALYWWEVDRQGLVKKQFDVLAGAVLPPGIIAVPAWTTLATFASHALLLTLMAAASLIDIDEKTIPDGITVPGTLLALLLATLLPMSLLPHVALRHGPPALPPVVGEAVPLPAPPGQAAAAPAPALYVEPLSLTAPNRWPAVLEAAPNWLSLVVALACYAIWCFALTPRLLRTRHGIGHGISIVMARVLRELRRPPLAWIALGGAAAIVGVWLYGGGPWLGLLTALVGMIGGSALAWSIRVIASVALRKEAMGFGDVTLMMMIGAFLGWQPSILVFFIGPFAALVVGVAQVILRRGDVIPYGPYLCLGAVVVVIRWADFWNADPLGFQAICEVPWLIISVLALGVIMLGALLVIWRNIKESIFGIE